MDIDDVVERLQHWASAVAGGRRGQFLGLPGHCTYLEFAIKATGESGPAIPEKDWLTDRLVRQLGETDPELRTVIEMAYLGTGMSNERATAAGISKATYFRRLDEAHHAMLALYGTVE
jgi:hypothetical protein